VNPPTFGLPNSRQYVILAIVPTWVYWPSIIPTITSLLTPLIAINVGKLRGRGELV